MEREEQKPVVEPVKLEEVKLSDLGFNQPQEDYEEEIEM